MFAVMSDLRRKAFMNPNIQVIRVELEGEEPVREALSSITAFREGRESWSIGAGACAWFLHGSSKAGVRLIHLSR